MSPTETLFRSFLETSWRASWLIVLLLVLRGGLRRLVPARVLFWAWIALAARLLIPFAVPVAWSPFNLAPLDARVAPALAGDGPPGASRLAPSAESTGPNRRTGSSVSRSERASDTAPKPTPALVFAESTIPLTSPKYSLFEWAAFAWSVAVIALLLARLWAHHRFMVRLRASSAVPDISLASLVAEAADELGVRGVRVAITDAVGAPALYGIVRPTLLFPPGLVERLEPRELRLVILHELAHCRRGDLLAHALIHAAQTVHWFNPVVWLAARAAPHDCELACDEFVVRHLGSIEPRIYGATLLKICGFSRPTPHARLGLGIVESKQQLKRRIQMIIANPSATFTRTVLGAALLALITGLSLTREIKAQPPAAPASAAASIASITTTAPTGWWKNGDKPASYVVGVDPTQPHDGSASAYTKSIEPSIMGFGGMMQMCSAETYLGKRLRLTAWMKTANASEGGAHLWFRIDGPDKDVMLGFDNMGKHPVRGTTDWQEYSLVLDVPANASALAYGFFVQGTGQAWVSGFKIEQVGPEVPNTNMDVKSKPSLPKVPVNLGFH